MNNHQVEALVTAVKQLAEDNKRLRSDLQQMQLKQARMRQQLNRIFNTTETTWLTKKDFVALLKIQGVLQRAAGKARSCGDDIRFFNSKLRADDIFVCHDGHDTPPMGTAVWKKSDRITLFHTVNAFEQFVSYYGAE